MAENTVATAFPLQWQGLKRNTKRSSRCRNSKDYYNSLPSLATTLHSVPEWTDASIPELNDVKPTNLPFAKINWMAHLRSGKTLLVIWAFVCISCITSITSRRIHLKGGAGKTATLVFLKEEVIVIPIPNQIHDTLEPMSKEDFIEKDFGGLEFTKRSNFSNPVAIHSQNFELAEEGRETLLVRFDEEHSEERYQLSGGKEDKYEVCRSPGWIQRSYPTCNAIHEKPIERYNDQSYDVRYIDSGTSRDAYRFQRMDWLRDWFILKRLVFGKHITAEHIYKVHKDAIVLEGFSHSPQVLDIYAHCGTSVLIEPMATELYYRIVPGDGLDSQERLDKLDNVYPNNNLTASEKLQIALTMAESIADLHGFAVGPITHADVHPEQWLIAPDGSIKLNDFNQAHEVQWNQEEERQCERTAFYGDTYKSPEEFAGTLQNESVDTYALGNNIYALLTGLWPFYDEAYRGISEEEIQESIILGKRPFVDPRYKQRSIIEFRLVQIMERCWEQDRKLRPSIFEVARFLHEVKMDAAARGDLQSSPLISIPGVRTSGITT